MDAATDVASCTLTVHTVPIPPLHRPIFDRGIRLLAGLIKEQRNKDRKKLTAEAKATPLQMSIHNPTLSDFPSL